ncbi:Quinol monooxygenase YgiN [Dyadobacter soli]|uniref:Quinol monooxygenase YgiN n=1 Tax=Dyadobacter soli TaxID=659014 RepID=A0A1G7MEN1_9BACT|nr:putative quinol monooxygenase [Dyadobacter soli]SDF60272.1 Quinol monooxygenase YgiN [Dyadobacter soli]
MSAITTIAKWEVKPGELKTVLSLLSQLAIKSKEEESNLFYNVLQSNADPNLIVLLEGYADETALTSHRNSEHFQQFVVQEIVPRLVNREVILAREITLDDFYPN